MHFLVGVDRRLQAPLALVRTPLGRLVSGLATSGRGCPLVRDVYGRSRQVGGVLGAILGIHGVRMKRDALRVRDVRLSR